MLLFIVTLIALSGVIYILVASMAGWWGTKNSHESFFTSRRFYHDDVTDLCFMVLSDKLGRGITIVPCEKVPSNLLIHFEKQTPETKNGQAN